MLYHCANDQLLKSSFHIKSATEFNPANSVLLVIAGKRQCRFAVMNYLSKELVEFGYYTSIDEEEDYKKFFEETETLSKRYYQSVIAYDSGETIQVPAAVYKYEDGPLYVDAAYGQYVHTTTISENVPGWNLFNVYRLPASLQSAAAWKFLSGKFWNLDSVILKSAMEKGEVIKTDFKPDEFTAVIVKENKLQLVKTFSYSTPEDVLYYLLKACQQVNLSQHTVKLSLSGLIEKDSAIYRELNKYFIHVEFESLPADIKIGEALRTHPDHYYSSICKLALCVS